MSQKHFLKDLFIIYSQYDTRDGRSAVRPHGLNEMATTEHTINDAIAAALRDTRRAWHASNVVSSENTGMLKNSNRRPDILVLEANVSPVVIETEVLPAVTVESEA